jgi:hypothetical protein
MPLWRRARAGGVENNTLCGKHRREPSQGQGVDAALPRTAMVEQSLSSSSPWCAHVWGRQWQHEARIRPPRVRMRLVMPGPPHPPLFAQHPKLTDAPATAPARGDSRRRADRVVEAPARGHGQPTPRRLSSARAPPAQRSLAQSGHACPAARQRCPTRQTRPGCPGAPIAALRPAPPEPPPLHSPAHQ